MRAGDRREDRGRDALHPQRSSPYITRRRAEEARREEAEREGKQVGVKTNGNRETRFPAAIYGKIQQLSGKQEYNDVAIGG